MRKISTIVLLLFIIFTFTFSYEVQELTTKLLNAETDKEANVIIRKILKEDPTYKDLTNTISNVKFPQAFKWGINIYDNKCIDGVTRPYAVYIPKKYNPSKKTPLLIYLHGGVGRADLEKDIEGFIQNSYLIKYSEEKGYILLFPLAHNKAMWWDKVGSANVLKQIRVIKSKYNIDENRVYMTGFSDGASGAFFFGMCHPDDFAGFIPWNGHPGVASIDGDTQTYFVNLFNTSFSVINTDLDSLYPDKKMRPMMELAQEAGADLLYRVYAGIGHEYAYADKELPRMFRFMDTHLRNMTPRKIIWETAYPELGKCKWLSINKIKGKKHKDWYKDYNMDLVDDRVMFGFFPDTKFKGPGVRVDGVVEEDTLFGALKVKKGDIVIKLGKLEVKELDDLNKYKEGKKRGDPAEITILRDGKEIELKGNFPPEKIYPLFKRELPSGRIEAEYSGNTFFIKTSKVSEFSIYINPDMVQLDQNVVINLNGKKVFDKKIEPDLKFMLNHFAETKDRQLIYVKKITIKD